MQDITVLFVDNEQRVLDSLRKNLKNEPYKKLYAKSGTDALKILDEEPVHVIVTDVKMQGMDGLTLLQKAKEKYPDSVRIVLSGFLHVSEIIPCINTGEIYRYVTKPAEVSLFKQTLNDAIQYFLFNSKKVNNDPEIKTTNEKLGKEIEKNERLQDKLRRLTPFDELTNIPNRRSFNKAIEREWKRAQRDQTPLSLIKIEIDFFKTFQGTYTRQAKDNCLKKIAESLSKILKRPGDLISRYGSGELAAILPNTIAAGAGKVAEDMRKNVESITIPNSLTTEQPHIFISSGVATMLPAQKDNSSSDNLITLASKALYVAKNGGENRLGIVSVPQNIANFQPKRKYVAL